MKVILLEKIKNLGDLGDTVNVKEGYARNFLLTQKKAVRATEENIAKFDARRAEFEKAAKEKLKSAEDRAKAFENLAITLKANAMEEGKLYGSIGVKEVVAALKEKGIEVEKSEVVLPDGPMHELGEFEVEAVLHSDVTVKFKVIVEAE